MSERLNVYRLMPANWDDIAGWDRYYEAYCAAGLHLDRMTLGMDWMMHAERFLKMLVQQGWRKIWFPGCGVTLAPHIYAALGFDVWASDASPVAIAVQEELRASVASRLNTAEIAAQHLPPDRLPPAPGQLHLAVHDFREPFVEDGFDCVYNIKSFQGLPPDSMKRAARSHYEALKPGRQAIFSTINVQGPLRDALEETLLEAGFYIPYHQADRWFRQAVARVGAPHAFILGRPRLGHRRWARGWLGHLVWKLDNWRASRYRTAYEARREAEAPSVEAILADGQTKVARVIYNTG